MFIIRDIRLFWLESHPGRWTIFSTSFLYGTRAFCSTATWISGPVPTIGTGRSLIIHIDLIMKSRQGGHLISFMEVPIKNVQYQTFERVDCM